MGLLVATTLFSWSPWAIATGIGAALTARGLFRLPDWRLLAAGLVLAAGAGSGWTVEVLIARANPDALYEHQAGRPENDTISGCFLFTDQAQAQLAQVWGAPNCAGAFAAWHSKVTVRDGFTATTSRCSSTATSAWCPPTATRSP